MPSKHTPGPWEMFQTGIYPKGSLYPVAHTNDHPDQEANARLIAAAPTLLGALILAQGRIQRTMHYLEGAAADDSRQALVVIAQVIADAEGTPND